MQAKDKKPKKNKKKGNGKFVMRLAVFFTAGALVLSLAAILITAGIFTAVLYIPTISIPEKYTVTTGKVDEPARRRTSYTLAENDAVHGGDGYLDFTALAEKCGFPVSGDSHMLKYKIPSSDGNDGTFVADIDNSRVIVNGSSVAVKNGIYYKGGKLYLPCMLIDDCFVGINVASEGNKIGIELEDEISLLFCEDNGSETVDIYGENL